MDLKQFLMDQNITIKRSSINYNDIALDYIKNNKNTVIFNNKNTAARGDKIVFYSLDASGDRIIKNEYNKNNGGVIMAALKNNGINVINIKDIIKK